MDEPGRGKYCVKALCEDRTEQVQQSERPGQVGIQKAKVSMEW